MDTDMEMTNLALFDMDGSLADYDTQLIKDLKVLEAPGEPVITELWEAERHYPHIAARMRLIKAQPGWWLNLSPIPEGMRIFALAREIGFHCEILTKGPGKHPLAWGEKVQWCHKHLPGINVNVVCDKGHTYGKLLYDDFPDYCRRWLQHRPHGLVIMPAKPYNQGFTHPRVVRWDGQNIAVVEQALRIAFARQHGEPLELPPHQP